MNEDKVSFKIESLPEEDKPVVPEAVAEPEKYAAHPSEETAAEQISQVNLTETADTAPQAEEEVGGSVIDPAAPAAPADPADPAAKDTMNENRETFAPNFEKKGYMKEWAVTALMAVLTVVGIVLALYVERYQFAGIVVAVLAVLGAAAMIKHVFVSEKVLKLIGDRDKVYLEELMQAMKRTKKPEFAREITTLIKEGHLVGYALMNDIYLEKRQKR